MPLSANEPPSRVAQVAFLFTKILCFTYCLFAGVRFTADALSRERREGTLGLLFLTDLRGYDVVLGKMVITSLNAFFALLAALPLLALPILIGGVSVGEFWRTTLVLINTLLFSLGVGMLISAFGVEERKVLLGTLLLLLLVTFGLPLIWRYASRISNPVWLEWVTLYPSPAHLLNVSASGLFVAVPSLFWPCMATVGWLTLFCLGVASVASAAQFSRARQPRCSRRACCCSPGDPGTQRPGRALGAPSRTTCCALGSCCRISSSIGSGPMLWPDPRMIRFLMRPMMRQFPAASTSPWSPVWNQPPAGLWRFLPGDSSSQGKYWARE